MKNIWKYASYNQRERANMIREGNDDVYNTEKARNKIMRDATKSLGLSTSKIDAWDNFIDDIHSSNNKRKGLPKFNSSRVSKINNEYKEQVKGINSDYQKKTDDAIEEAVLSSEYLAEYLANKGYSLEGSTYKQRNDKLEKELEYELEKLTEEFNAKLKNARERYLRQL